MCEVAYFFRRPPNRCLEDFSLCDDFGRRLHLIIKRYGPGKTGNERLVIWPAAYQVERKRLWSIGNIKIGLYEMTGSATAILMAKQMHLNQAIYAVRKKYRAKKAQASND